MKKTLLIFILVMSFHFSFSQNCNDLFISEYVEGRGYNKALELYNPTGSEIDLSSYSIGRYRNGQTTMDTELSLSGTIQPYDVFVILIGDDAQQEPGQIAEELKNIADMRSSGIYEEDPMFFNGNDALVLMKSGDVVDIFARIGPPELDDGWCYESDEEGGYIYEDCYWKNIWTKDHALIRKSTVQTGVTENPTPFNVSLEWDSLPRMTDETGPIHELGSHECTCDPEFSSIQEIKVKTLIYPNPVKNNMLYVKANDKITGIEIMNAIGQTIHKQKNTSINTEINVNINNLESGLYLVKINLYNKKPVVRKIIVD